MSVEDDLTKEIAETKKGPPVDGELRWRVGPYTALIERLGEKAHSVFLHHAELGELTVDVAISFAEAKKRLAAVLKRRAD
jgi:hypothetical protein